MREILNAIFYVVRSGCARRLLPHEFPAWQTAYHYFRLWRMDGTWEHLMRSCASNSAYASAATLSRVLRSSIASRFERLVSAVFAATMVPSASTAANAT